ncbi:MAG: hypothetical protein K0R82_1885 [Flavipsychrobacter sp.]|jgi:hypothetical protein|nr:hypothetical protein [Flavipsychrobacter sp.]
MKQFFRIIGVVTFFAICGCHSDKRVNWQITLENDNKEPYGSYLAFQSLKYYFPNAKINSLSKGFRYTGIDNSAKPTPGKKLLILLGLDFYVSKAELDTLMSFAQKGNEVMIFCSDLDEKIEHTLGCYKQANNLEEIKLTEFNTGRQNIDALSLAVQPGQKFGYEGRSLQGHFLLKNLHTDNTLLSGKLTATRPDTLGFYKKTPNFLRYTVGNGHITLHAAPLVMSNYFLLQKNNRRYLDGIWQSIPGGINQIYWSQYFKHNGSESNFGVLLKYPATRWALVAAAFTLLAYVAFESKRRQRIIPVIAKPENSSVSFVETVGRLYYNTGDHNGIAEKMIQHFLEWVRVHYYLNTSELNTHFATQLANKSGIDLTEAQQLVKTIHDIKLRNISMDEITLATLHQRFEQLYHNYRSKNGNPRHQSATTY